ncbi:Protocadherin beta-16 [Willisornis vidua]|uniref:Protocadherin beta-16 n=1 Tax=Willisornis vidua TaxID=1566151 RepID=A0ABQ9DAT5_9PASS|nr:Protocadherin beta-16 [Willisornis vidua]
MKLRKSEDPFPGRVVALILLCISGMKAETARYSVPEEGERDSFVANIGKDLGLTGEELSARQARLVPDGEKQYLQLNQHTGDLVVREQMDREELCGQSEPCLVHFEVLLESPLQSFRAEVRLIDINDHAPVFLNKEIVLKVPESAMPETRFLLESAQDPDVGNNSLQHYSISSNEYFHVYTRQRNDGRRYAELVLNRALDREQQAEVAFSITAVDGGTPPRSGTALIRVVVLDINDNSPIFTRSVYKVSVKENSSQDVVVVVVSASDLDSGKNGEVAYSIFQNSEENLETFKINTETGQIRLKKTLDYEETKSYEIDVQATDGGGLSAHCKVEVQVEDVNDNAPEVIITSLTSTLSEASPPNTVVALFNVRDRDSGDNGRTTCELAGEQPFSISLLAADAYALVTSEALDREEVAEYNVTVRARDKGSPALSSSKTLLVWLLDVNDNAPTFTQDIYTMVISENEPAGTSLGRLRATDADTGENARVRYAIEVSSPGTPAAASFISVDVDSGTVRTLRPLDYEKVRAFELVVRASDSGSPSLSTQAVLCIMVQDQNDNAPVVLHPPRDSSAAGELVPRWAPSGYLVAKVVAVDVDAGQNAWLSYELAKATEPGLFRVGLHSGEVHTARAVIERDSSWQRLIVLVRDRGQPPRSTTATLAVTLVHDFSDAFLQQDQDPVSRQQPQAAKDDLLTTYLIASLGCISSLFLLSALALATAKLCKARLQAHLSPPSPSCYTDGDFVGNGIDVASMGTLSPAYRYEVCLTTGSGRSEFQFLRPVLLSPQSSAEVGPDKDEDPLCRSQPAGEREAYASSTAPSPV